MDKLYFFKIGETLVEAIEKIANAYERKCEAEINEANERAEAIDALCTLLLPVLSKLVNE